MMKLKALRNIGGVVQAQAGQEFEVNNVQARDLINQGVAYPVSNSGAEVKALFENQDSEALAMEQEMATIERIECENAYSEAVQGEVNKLEDERQKAMEQVKQQAKSQAEQKFQQQTQSQATQQSTESSQFKGENQLNNQRF